MHISQLVSLTSIREQLPHIFTSQMPAFITRRLIFEAFCGFSPDSSTSHVTPAVIATLYLVVRWSVICYLIWCIQISYLLTVSNLTLLPGVLCIWDVVEKLHHYLVPTIRLQSEYIWDHPMRVLLVSKHTKHHKFISHRLLGNPCPLWCYPVCVKPPHSQHRSVV